MGNRLRAQELLVYFHAFDDVPKLSVAQSCRAEWQAEENEVREEKVSKSVDAE